MNKTPAFPTLTLTYQRILAFAFVWEMSLLFKSIFLKIYLLIYFWLCWVFTAACRLSLVAGSGGYSSLQCTGFSLWGLLLLWNMGSRHLGFSNFGLWAQQLTASGLSCPMACGIFPEQGSNPCPLHWPPGKALKVFLFKFISLVRRNV